MPKANCKYWDKCYQRNEEHLEKYNHPSRQKETEKIAPKRKAEDKEEHAEVAKTNISTDSNMEEAGNFEAETAELHNEAMNNISGKNYMEMLEKRIRLSVQKEYDNLCGSNEFIRHKFLVEMPPDFYEFWEFINTLKKETTKAAALQHIETVFQLQLVGPFEFLAGKFHAAKIGEPGDYLRHWRFYYDPPEFQTVFVRRGSGVHYGYWRDIPQDKEKLLIARNDASGCEFDFIAGNIFDAFLYYLEHDFPATPFNAAQVAATKNLVKQYTSEKSLELGQLESLRTDRNKNVVAKTLHRAGIVVPFDRKTQQGYRPLQVSDAELKKILALFDRKDLKSDSDTAKQAVLEKLQPIANAANIAVDECDFGSALELGIDLFCSGHKELHMLASSLLVPAYSLLARPQFIAIAKAHMERRNRDNNLSIFDILN
ncbi:histone PARylation factor 1-like [Drosophila busckii]|nr:histone PARylation factor 1-like [Drosophila busckii]